MPPKRDVTRCPREGPATGHQQRVANTTMRRARDLLEEHEGSANDALFAACESGDSDVVVCLVRELGAHVVARDSNKRIPLHIAALNGHAEVVRVLVKDLGTDVRFTDYDRSALDMAAEKGHTEVVRVLLRELGAADCADRQGKTALHVAASKGHFEVVRLLALGVDVGGARDKDGNTPPPQRRGKWPRYGNACFGGRVRRKRPRQEEGR